MAAPSTFKKGAIVRVKLQQFLTYEDVEFRPGPRLNVVMGPNGTGKSSIVCAIAIGLGASPKVLGRADTLTEFILTGRDEARTEIELLANEATGKTHTVERHITKSQRGTSKWKIDGKAATEPQVKKLVEGLNIQIANLCTFLPQEKVGEFSAFDDVGLLKETELALGGRELLNQHEKLVEMEKSAAVAARASRSAGEELEDVERRLKELEPDQARLQRKREHEAKALLCEQRLAWVRFEEKKAEALEAKEAKNAAKQAYKDADAVCAPLRKTLDDARAAMQADQQRYKKVQDDISAKIKGTKAAKDAFEKAQEKLGDATDDAGKLEGVARKNREHADKLARQATDAERKLRALGHVDQAGIKRRVQELRPALEAARQADLRAKDAAEDARAAADGPARDLDDARRRLARLGGGAQRRANAFVQGHGRAGDECLRLRKWLDANGARFRKPVLGPIGLEMNCKSDAARALVETVVGVWIFRSFVCQSKADYDVLYNQVVSAKLETINLHNVETVKGNRSRPYGGAVLQRLKAAGAQGYIDEFVEAPAPIMEVLRGHHQIHGVLVGDARFQAALASDAVAKDLNTPKGYLCLTAVPDARERGKFNVWRYHATVSAYSKDTTVVSSCTAGPRGFIPDAAADEGDEEARLKATEAAAAKALDAAKTACQKADAAAVTAEKKVLEAQRKTNVASKDLTAFNQANRALEMTKEKAERADRKARASEQDLQRDKEKQRRKVAAALAKVVDALKAYAKADDAGLKATRLIAPAMALRTFGQDRHKLCEEALVEKEALSEELRKKTEAAMAAFDDLKTETRALKDAAERAAPLEDEALQERLHELPDKLDELEAILDGERKEARAIHEDDGLAPKIQALQKRKAELADKVGGMDAANEKHQSELDALKAPWERTLKEALGHLRSKFREYMAALGARGDVQLVEADSFAKWGLAILVAFRDSSDLQQLAAHVQSGGERSVSTIMYLMALQAHLPSPFRVVDEINQGMDEVNERIVFRRIVANSTGPDAPQYWLITPKLLQGLYDMEHPDVRALVVYNGAYNVKRPADWDLSAFLAKKRRAAAAR